MVSNNIFGGRALRIAVGITVLAIMLLAGSASTAGNTSKVDQDKSIDFSQDVFVSPSLKKMISEKSEGFRSVIILLQPSDEIMSIQKNRNIPYSERSEQVKSSKYYTDIINVLRNFGDFDLGDMEFATVNEKGKYDGTYILFLNAIKMKVPITKIDEITRLPFVKEIWDGDAEIKLKSSSNTIGQSGQSVISTSCDMKLATDDPYSYWNCVKSNNWGLYKTGIDKLQSGYDGTGKTVAIIDTGIDVHHPVYNPVVDGKPWTKWKMNVIGYLKPPILPLDDKDGHGTADAGVVWEIAPNSSFIIIDIITIKQGIDGINFAIQQGANVITSSAGFDPNSCDDWFVVGGKCASELATAASNAVDADTSFTASAGNKDDNPIAYEPFSPSTGTKVLSVSSIDSVYNLYEGGSPINAKNGKPNLSAPGYDIYTLNISEKSDGTGRWYGSSFAAPHVAGTLLLLRQKGYDAPTAENILKNTAIDDPSTPLDGKGRVSIVPTTPILIRPYPDAVINTLTPEYNWKVESDLKGQKLTKIHIRVWEDTGKKTAGTKLVLDKEYSFSAIQISGSYQIITPSSADYINGGLVNGKNYHWHVRAYNGYFWSDWANDATDNSDHRDFSVSLTPTPTVTPTPTPSPTATPTPTSTVAPTYTNQVELSYDNGNKYWAASDSDFGLAVRFTLPASEGYINKVRLYGSRYGTTIRNFDIEIWDTNLNTVYSASYPYDAYFPESYNTYASSIFNWAEISVPNIKVSSDFYVVFFSHTGAPPWVGAPPDAPDGGVQIGLSQSGNQRSYEVTKNPNTISSSWRFTNIPQSSADFMIRATVGTNLPNTSPTPTATPTPSTTTSTSAGNTKGDVSSDGQITVVDALFTAQYTVGLRTFTPAQLGAADVNGDGQVNVVDALFIAQYTVGLRQF